MKKHPLFRHPAMRILRRITRRELRVQLLGGSGLFAGGLLFAYAFFGTNTFVAGLGLLISVIGIKLGADAAREWRTEGSRLLELLRNRPRQIVWIYSVVTERMPFGLQFSKSCIMYFKLLDGDEITIELPIRHLKVVSKLLNRLLPHATFGYSIEYEQQYLSSPALLLRNGEVGP